MVGPALTAMFKWGDWEHPLYVLMLYADHRRLGRIPAAAVFDEAHRQDSNVGVHSGADCVGDCNSVLGCASRASVVGGRVCL